MNERNLKRGEEKVDEKKNSGTEEGRVVRGREEAGSEAGMEGQKMSHSLLSWCEIICLVVLRMSGQAL